MTQRRSDSFCPFVLFLSCALLAACGPASQEPASATAGAGSPAAFADTVFVNGDIYTVDGMRSWAEAVAITNGRISYVGTNRGVEALVGPDTRRIDLGGRMMLPGLHDIHIHPISGGMEALACDLNSYTALDQYLDAIAQCAAARPDEPWVLGGGWLMSVFGPGANASRELLDGIVPDRPVFLSSADGHSAWVNSKALEIAGITAKTPDPVDGIIDREPGSGEPVGSLQEGAMDLVEARIPEPTQDDRAAGLRYAIEMLNSYGITSIQSAAVGQWDLESELAVYHELDEAGELNVRTVAAMWWRRDRGLDQIDTFKKDREVYTSGRLSATSVKIMQDGVMENFTAAMLEPYAGQGGTRGIPMVEPELLKEAVTELDAAGFQVHFHAIGDAAIRQSLDAVEAARDANGAGDNRHHISHLELIDPVDIPRFRELNVVANFQPLWAFADDYITELTVPFIGPARSRWLYPIGSVYRSGGMIAFGSDWSVSTANPFPQIEVAVTRKNPGDAGDTVFISEELVSLPEAIAAFTINGAYVNHSEKDTGSIEVGKYADLVVLDQNLFEIEPEDISETKALLTLVEGDFVYGDSEAL